MEWMGTRVAEDVVHNLRMAHMQVWKLYTAVHDLQSAAVREGVDAARHRKQQKEALAEAQTQIEQMKQQMKQQKEALVEVKTQIEQMKQQIDQMKRRDAEMKVRIKSLQRQEKKRCLLITAGKKEEPEGEGGKEEEEQTKRMALGFQMAAGGVPQ